MKVAIIAPTKYLETFSSKGTMEMCLSHEAVRNSKYLDYFKKKKEEGKWVLMDNGAHEGERVDGQELYDLSKKINPSCLILPDVLDNYQQTRDDTLKFYKEFGQKVLDDGVSLMAVPQGETFEKYLENYKTFTQLENVDYIGISYTILFNDIPGGYQDKLERDEDISKAETQLRRRYFLIKYLLENNLLDTSKKHHLLGLVNPFEFILLSQLLSDLSIEDSSFLHSCDSALAYVCGKNQIVLDSSFGLVGERAKSLEDFNEDIDLTYEQKLKINHNTRVIKSMVHLLNLETGHRDLELD